MSGLRPVNWRMEEGEDLEMSIALSPSHAGPMLDFPYTMRFFGRSRETLPAPILDTPARNLSQRRFDTLCS